MTAWDFSPEQREILADMIATALQAAIRDGHVLPGPSYGGGITLAPAPVVLDIGKPISDAPAFGAGVAAGSLAVEHHPV